MADARRQAQQVIAEGKEAGERVRRDIEEKARAEGDAMIERARESIEREKDAALGELRKESVDLALAAAGKLVQESLDEKKDRELVMGFIDELSSGNGIEA
jgi:F-type H+-transporting ATPase subunit b